MEDPHGLPPGTTATHAFSMPKQASRRATPRATPTTPLVPQGRATRPNETRPHFPSRLMHPTFIVVPCEFAW